MVNKIKSLTGIKETAKDRGTSMFVPGNYIFDYASAQGSRASSLETTLKISCFEKRPIAHENHSLKNLTEIGG